VTDTRDTSASAPTADDLRALALRVPTWFRLDGDAGEVRMTLTRPGDPLRRPLVTFAIAATAGHRLSDGPLGALVEELGRATMVAYHAAAGDLHAAPMLRILQVANDPPLMARARAVPGGELTATTHKIHTAAIDDWFATPDDPPATG
jgi:hypothetical protein